MVVCGIFRSLCLVDFRFNTVVCIFNCYIALMKILNVELIFIQMTRELKTYDMKFY